MSKSSTLKHDVIGSKKQEKINAFNFRAHYQHHTMNVVFSFRMNVKYIINNISMKPKVVKS